jgi:hypothetical protein
MIATVKPLTLHLYQENLTRNHRLLNIRITDKYILHMHALHIQMAKWNDELYTNIVRPG